MSHIPPTMIIDPPYEVEAALYFLKSGEYLYKNGAAKFVTAKDVAAAFSQREEDTGWLPAGVVRCGHNARGDWYVYTTPEQQQDINLEIEEGLLAIKIPLPRLVLLGIGSDYYLWALAGRHFDPNGKARKAPFPNVHDNGKVCWGANRPPTADPAKARAAWNLFFDAPFSNHLVNGKSKKQSGDVRDQLRILAGKNAKHYPPDDLVDTRRTIGGWINDIVGERRR